MVLPADYHLFSDCAAGSNSLPDVNGEEAGCRVKNGIQIRHQARHNHCHHQTFQTLENNPVFCQFDSCHSKVIKYSKQECILVGYVPPASVSVSREFLSTGRCLPTGGVCSGGGQPGWVVCSGAVIVHRVYTPTHTIPMNRMTDRQV